MVIRNSIYNMLGLGLPVLVALAAIPLLISNLGEERFGILTIIWAVVSYFGLFDLGLGRAVTQQVAASIATDDYDRLSGIIGTSTGLMLALGIVAGVMMLLLTPLLAQELVQRGDADEVAQAFNWMALAMPAIVLTSGYRGILEAVGRFGLINAIRFPMGVFTYAGPMIVVIAGHARLDVIAAVLCAGRIIACACHWYFAVRAVPRAIGNGTLDKRLVRPLLSMGGWMSVSNVVSPLMSYVDRFVLAFTTSSAAVAYYATPQELVLRTGIIPTAVSAVLFPLFASAAAGAYEGNLARIVWRYSLLIFVLMLPITLLLIFFAEPLLAWWISPTFATHAAQPLQIMSVAALCSGLAQVPFSMVQGTGRAATTAKLHLIELPLYLGLLYVLVVQYGIMGAAWAWLIRIGADMLLMYCLCAKGLRNHRA